MTSNISESQDLALKLSRAKANDKAARALDAIEANVAILDNQGLIIVTNRAWREFAAGNPLSGGMPPRSVGVGSNYLNICLTAKGESSENAMIVFAGIRAVLDGRKRLFSLEYPCHSQDRQRWFLMKVKPLRHSKPREAVVIHVDITDRRLAEMDSFVKQKQLTGALAQLQAMASRIKYSIESDQPTHFVPDALTPQVTASHQSQPQAASEMLKSLSRRELEVLIGLAHGERNSAIAARLHLSKKSVSTYRFRVLEKLNLESNVQLVEFAAQAEYFIQA